MKKKARKRRSVKYWRKLFSEHQESNLTVREFCISHDINFHTFSNWRWRIRQKNNPEKNPTGKFIPAVASKSFDSVALCEHSSDRPAEVVSENLKTSKYDLTLRYGDDWSIEVPCGFDESTLRRVIKVLGV